MFTVLWSILFVLNVLMNQSVWAATSVDIEIGNAKTIVDLDKRLSQAVAKLANPGPNDDKGALKRAVDELQVALDRAVKATAFGPTTTQGVARAKELVQKSDLVARLQISLAQPEIKPDERETLAEALKLAQSNMEQSTVQISESERLKTLADERFAGFNFGVALGVIVKAGKRNLIQSASLDPNGIVRIDRDNDTTANLILESHYFFTPDATFLGIEARNWGIGPFVAVQPGTENIIQSIGGGLMLGLKRSSILLKEVARDRGDSFNLGFGVMVNPNSKVLGDGIQKNQPLPGGETVVRLKTTTEMGYLITFSYSF